MKSGKNLIFSNAFRPGSAVRFTTFCPRERHVARRSSCGFRENKNDQYVCADDTDANSLYTRSLVNFSPSRIISIPCFPIRVLLSHRLTIILSLLLLFLNDSQTLAIPFCECYLKKHKDFRCPELLNHPLTK